MSVSMPFAARRLVAFALLMGMAMFTIAVAVFLETNEGKGLLVPPMKELDVPVVATAGAACAVALLLRGVLNARALSATAELRDRARMVATVVPMAVLEGACCFALVAWMLNGNAVPNLVAALGVLSCAIAIAPLNDPDATSR